MTQVDESASESPAEQDSTPRGRLGVVAVAAATFTVVTSEMLPVGLLTPMSDVLQVSEGTAGLSLTVTGVVAAVSAPLLTSGLGRFDRRWVFCGLLAVLVLGNLRAAWSPNFGVLVLARVLVGIGMGGVWAMAAAVAVRLVPPESAGSATSLVFSGVAVASVLGIPAGAFIGALAGWRMAFAAAAGLALLVLVAAAVLLPRLPADRVVSLGGVLRLAGNPRVRTGLLIVTFLVTGHFAAYTYVRPVLEEVSGARSGIIGLLLVYGIAGVVGNFVAGSYVVRAPRATLVAISTVLAITVIVLPALGGSMLVAGLLMVVWGLTYGGVSVSSLTWVVASAPGFREGVSALLSSVFNAAIAVGALVGGLAADGIGITATMWVGGALAGAAMLNAVFGQAPAGGKV
ncbi:MFS transporter [Nocardia sp. NBC_01009]|uniref:MFS transporter n=1 Tax=Nocardia sp. NBC_01009 TaxID=2975996 RepID=UPI0038693CEF|nr:MFS transporter [Nocardia sp. NBC_01009]